MNLQKKRRLHIKFFEIASKANNVGMFQPAYVSLSFLNNERFTHSLHLLRTPLALKQIAKISKQNVRKINLNSMAKVETADKYGSNKILSYNYYSS